MESMELLQTLQSFGLTQYEAKTFLKQQRQSTRNKQKGEWTRWR
ncbi:hypothetical protein [Aneurinibacillus tyrosinisolvens]|nr:hypothetical protein [Aneurinibacillus tyrosinisolvens]